MERSNRPPGPPSFTAPAFLAIGHATHDQVHDRWQLGGTACYAAFVASRLGVQTALLTSAHASTHLAELLPGVCIICGAAAQTTSFTHRYETGRRVQFLHARAEQIGPKDVPAMLHDAGAVLLGSVCGEVEPALAAVFPRALIGATAQGWLRRFGGDGLVSEGHTQDLCPQAFAGRLSALFLSEEDLDGAPLPPRWLRAIPIVAVTRGRLGARLYAEQCWWHMPAFPAREVDATGAGDAFAAAFLLRYRESAHVAEAARYAAAVASFIVEAIGLTGAPSQAAVEQRLRKHPEIQLRKE